MRWKETKVYMLVVTLLKIFSLQKNIHVNLDLGPCKFKVGCLFFKSWFLAQWCKEGRLKGLLGDRHVSKKLSGKLEGGCVDQLMANLSFLGGWEWVNAWLHEARVVSLWRWWEGRAWQRVVSISLLRISEVDFLSKQLKNHLKRKINREDWSLRVFTIKLEAHMWKCLL